MKKILFYFFLFVSNAAFAQEIVFSGRVTDAQTGEGMPFVSIYFKNSTLGTTTNFEGNYTFKLINGLGQVMLTRQVNYHEGDNLITLKVSSNMVDESYRLEVTKPDKTTASMNVLLQ